MSEEKQTEKDGWGSRYKCSPVGERGTNCVSPAARAFRIPTILIVHIFGRGGSWIHPVGLFSNLPVIVCYYQLAHTTRDNNLKEDTASICRPDDALNALMTGILSLTIARRSGQNYGHSHLNLPVCGVIILNSWIASCLIAPASYELSVAQPQPHRERLARFITNHCVHLLL